MKLQKPDVFKKPTKALLVRSGIAVVLALAVGGTGAFVAAKNNAHNSYGTVAAKRSAKAASADSTPESSHHMSMDSQAGTTAVSTDPTTSANGEAKGNASATPTFSFVDTSDWVTENSRDGSFSIKYNGHLAYATCPDIADNLMTAMVAFTGSDMDCGSLQKAVSEQPYMSRSDSYVMRTETAIAQTDEAWDRGSAKPIAVTLASGQTAQRYAYDSTILGKNYHTIEYDTTVDGKKYVAVNNWQVIRNPNTPVDDFDTMVQKTWIFN